MENQINVGDQNTQQITQTPTVKPVVVPKKPNVRYWIVFPFFIVIILAVSGFFVVYLYNKNKNSSNLQKTTSGSLKFSEIKIGEYEVKSVTTNNKSWEEVVYKSTTVVEDGDKIYRAFSELYPGYTNSKKNFYIKDIILRGDVAEVHFGGDEEELVNRMGSTGPYNYTGQVTFALTEDTRIKKVDFKIYTQGSHFVPGPAVSRDGFIYLWTTPMLKEAAKNGNETAKEILDFRSTESTTTNNNSEEAKVKSLIAEVEKFIQNRNVKELMSLFTPAKTAEETVSYRNLTGLDPDVGAPRLFNNVSSNFIVTSWKIAKHVYPDNQEIISRENDSKYVVVVEETRKSWCNADPCAGTYFFENSNFYVFEIIKKDSQWLVDKYYPQKASPQSPLSTKYEAFGF